MPLQFSQLEGLPSGGSDLWDTLAAGTVLLREVFAAEHLKYGAATLRAEVDASNVDISITLAPPTGRAYVDLTSTGTGSPSYVTALAGLAAGDQLEYSNVVGGVIIDDLVVFADGTYITFGPVTSFDVRVWRASTLQWESIVTQAVVAGDQTITPSGVTSSFVTGSLSLSNVAARILSATGVATSFVSGSATVANVAARTLAPTGIATAAAVGTSAVANVAARTLAPTGIASGQALGSAVLANVAARTLAPTGLSTAAAFGSSTLANAAAQSVLPTGVATGSAVGAATLTSSLHLKYGSATLRAVVGATNADISISIAPPVGRVFIDLTSTNTGSAYYLTALAGLAAGDQIEASNAVGGSIDDILLSVDGTYENIGTVTSFDVRVWRAATSTWGAIATQLVTKDIVLTGVPTGAAIGAVTVAAAVQSISTTGVTTGAAVGSAVLANVAARTLAPSGIATGDAVGAATVSTAAQSITPAGLATASAIGAATLALDVADQLKYGSATLRATVGGDDADISIALVPPTGRAYIDVATPHATPALRLTSSPDIASGDQIEWGAVVGGVIGDVIVNDDATWDAAVGVTSFDFRVYDNANHEWGAWATQDVIASLQSISPAGISTGAVIGPTTSAILASTVHLKFGAATLRATVGGTPANIAITLAPPTGSAYTDIGTPDVVADNRLTATPDLASGDQIHFGNVVGGVIGDVVVNSDATFDVAVSVTAFDFRVWSATTTLWGPWATQTIDVSTQAITATGLVSVSAVGGAVVAKVAARSIGVTGLASAAALGAPVLSRPVLSVSVAGLASAAAIGSLTLAKVAARVLTPGAIASAAAIGAPVLVNVAARSISVTGVPTGMVVGSHVVANIGIGNQSISVEGLATTFAAGTAVVASVPSRLLSPAGIASAAAYGTVTVNKATPQALAPAGVASGVGLGTPALAGVGGQTISVAGVTSSVALGTLLVSHATVQGVAPTGLASGAALGVMVVTQPAQFIFATGIVTGLRFGATVFTGGTYTPPTDKLFVKVFQPLWMPVWTVVVKP